MWYDGATTAAPIAFFLLKNWFYFKTVRRSIKSNASKLLFYIYIYNREKHQI